ncbi:cyclic nucleotide-binding domain-containing protein [Oscillatoria amoena NRMC-F 0135]|nr:cyclic nucleotide-binding domain-containing protein [Oscillatoria laete-virens]MDL5048655.1 cyclic nucleotide-binding domain-containing protein [Oscillatoria amoena NRMC-F 0135]MDL5053253.1 cyclic nucleotide-binding domain-containing protein [Oscillatoria laete-virens NRMC-F 0139]
MENFKTAYYKEKDVILEEGMANDALYLVQNGSVDVVKIQDDKEILLAHIGPKGFFGEASLFHSAYATATVVAVQDTCINYIKHNALLDFIHDRPEAGVKILLEILRSACYRLSAANEKLGDFLYWINTLEPEGLQKLRILSDDSDEENQ